MILRVKKYRFRGDFANDWPFQKVVSFSAMCHLHLLVCKCGFWTRSNIYIKCSKEVGKMVATSLLWSCPRNVFFSKFFLFAALPERLFLFKYGLLFQTFLLLKDQLNSENIMYRVRCDFAKEGQRHCHIENDISRKHFRFLRCLMNVVFVFQYAFWEWPHFHIECLIEMWGVIIFSWTWICEKKP